MKLYHCVGTRSLRCLWALEELGMPYELELLPFPPRTGSPEYLQINSLGTVPFLVDGETWISESNAILQYLAAKCDSAGLQVKPHEPDFGRWLNWIHFGEASLTNPAAIAFRYAVSLPKDRRNPEVVADFNALFLERLKYLEDHLMDREYLCANRFTIADISVGYAIYLGAFMRLQDKFPPLVSSYLKRLMKRNAFQTAAAKQGNSGT